LRSPSEFQFSPFVLLAFGKAAQEYVLAKG
jgi:hypothetical protein